MKPLLKTLIPAKELKDFKEFMAMLADQENKYLMKNDIWLMFLQFCDDNKKGSSFRERSSTALFLKRIQEMFIREEHMIIAHRRERARYRFYCMRTDGEYLEEITPAEFLSLKDAYVLKREVKPNPLRLDFMPFYDFFPSLKDTQSIGSGIRFLNRYQCSRFFQEPEKWNAKLFKFIKLHQANGRQLLVNGGLISDFDQFFTKLKEMQDWLKKKKPDDTFAAVESKMRREGFEVGWGDTVGRILETMECLLSLIYEPVKSSLEEFISRVPMPLIKNIVIISPHGWFAQENVLGRPDTGGQVIYILDQVKSLEKHLKQHLQSTGLNITPKILVVTRRIPEAGNTTCNQKKEKIKQTENSWILRIPFKDEHYNIVNHWISRFHIWPYLEQFAQDAAVELQSELQGRPDLIIGNYSDGNLVATLLSDKFSVTQCTIAHALEKSKYLFSDLYWQDVEKDYHFSLQFTADMLSMNKSDFIITSTLQEIIGTEDTIGQYESYLHFTLPGLYQVTNGINLYAPKFNVIPPGVDEDLYFPYHLKDKRISAKTRRLEKRLFAAEANNIYGKLKDPEKIPIFTMARLDRIKNITGLIEAFGMSKKLRKKCNLIFSAGTIHFDQSRDAEEQDQIRIVYRLIEQYDLYQHIRWLPNLNRLETGEVYRIMADRQGIFVQPALFEAFGLTILEAMISGLPTFGPTFGGPAEIIEYGVSGFLLNTSKPELIAQGLEKFFQRWDKDPDYWSTISENGIKRVRDKYNWKSYSQRLVELTKLYGFWRFSVSAEGKIKMDRYSDLIWHFLFKHRVDSP